MNGPIKDLPSRIGDTLKNIRDIHHCDLLTALQVYCTSWGKFQFMGETLYSAPINLPFPIPIFWSSEVVQGSIFQKFVREKDIDITVDPPRMVPLFCAFVIMICLGLMTPGTVYAWIIEAGNCRTS